MEEVGLGAFGGGEEGGVPNGIEGAVVDGGVGVGDEGDVGGRRDGRGRGEICGLSGHCRWRGVRWRGAVRSQLKREVSWLGES